METPVDIIVDFVLDYMWYSIYTSDVFFIVGFVLITGLVSFYLHKRS